jgi:ubiquinone/menaquinone biosynthesis C-methylase UbiE
MNEYFSLAPYYDKLMPEEDYRLWAALCEKLFSDLNGKTILDLACGTGRLSFMLADRGFEVIGADISCEMLAVAEAKRSAYKGGIPPLFLNQAAQELDLYGTVQAVVCSMDGINYIEPESIERALSKVSLFLEERCSLRQQHAGESWSAFDVKSLWTRRGHILCWGGI